jgi:hypothetical protein
VALHGPDGEALGSFDLVAPNAEGLPAMLDQGVKGIDAIYVRALGEGNLNPDPTLTIEEPQAADDQADLVAGDQEEPLGAIIDQAVPTAVQVETPDSAALDAALAALRGTPGVGAPSVVSLALGGTSLLSFSMTGDLAAVRAALAARGWALEGEAATLRMRRTAPAAAVPPPESKP